MENIPDVPCLVCQKQRGEVKIPGGIILENDLIAITHAYLFKDEKVHYLGHLLVETKRHVAELAELTEAESQELGRQVSRAARALMAVLPVVHVYAFAIVDGVPHMHIHVIGRYPDAPREFWGAKVDEWPDAPKGGEVEIADLAGKIRTWFQSNST